MSLRSQVITGAPAQAASRQRPAAPPRFLKAGWRGRAWPGGAREQLENHRQGVRPQAERALLRAQPERVEGRISVKSAVRGR